MKQEEPKLIKRVWKSYKYVLAVILVGVIFLVVPVGGGTGKESEEVDLRWRGDFDTQQTEQRLAQVLSEIRGVGSVQVLLTVKESRRQVLAYDTQKDPDSGRYDTVIISKGSGNQQPVVLNEVAPRFQGAVVVCDGADDPVVKLAVLESVAAATGLSADEIAVCSRN